MATDTQIEHLLSRISIGDKQALESLYMQTSPKLFAICLGVLPDRIQAEQALQTVFLRIWKKAELYRVKGLSPMTWLITLTRDVAIDRARQQRRENAGGGQAPSGSRSSLWLKQGAGKNLPGQSAETGALLRRAYFKGESYAEMSHRSGGQVDALRNKLRAAVVSLRDRTAP